MSLLRVADMAPGLLVGLVAGVWVDRLRRRPILIWADDGGVRVEAAVRAEADLVVSRVVEGEHDRQTCPSARSW